MGHRFMGHTQPLGHPPVYMLYVTLTQNGEKVGQLDKRGI